MWCELRKIANIDFSHDKSNKDIQIDVNGQVFRFACIRGRHITSFSTKTLETEHYHVSFRQTRIIKPQDTLGMDHQFYHIVEARGDWTIFERDACVFMLARD
jgi:hypothetical protein